MFTPASSVYNPILIEEQDLKFWKLRRSFIKSSDLRQGSAELVTYAGPRAANEKPTLQALCRKSAVRFIQHQRSIIQFEPLARDLQQNDPPEGAARMETWFEGRWLKVGIQPI